MSVLEYITDSVIMRGDVCIYHELIYLSVPEYAAGEFYRHAVVRRIRDGELLYLCSLERRRIYLLYIFAVDDRSIENCSAECKGLYMLCTQYCRDIAYVNTIDTLRAYCNGEIVIAEFPVYYTVQRDKTTCHILELKRFEVRAVYKCRRFKLCTRRDSNTPLYSRAAEC